MMSKLRNLSSERLPHDVVIDILTRLPVKSLIRFRCVSKSWYSTITDPIFITKHLNLQLNNKAKSLSSNNNHNGFLLYTHDEQLYTAACNGGPTLTLTEVSEFQIPFPVNHYMVDHCNGMFLIYGNRDALIYLWNPNIQKFKMLTIAEGRSRYSLGLAYHCQNNDFKILKIVCNNKGPRFEAKVYALSTDLWRRIEFSVESIPNLGSILDIQYEPFLFFNGALHCMAYTRGKNNTNNFILSFDVNDEIFREIRLPENYLDGFIFVDRAVHRLVVFKGSLALIVFGLPDTPVYEDGEVLDKCDIWVMGQYGVVESWTKKTVGLGRIKNFFGCTESGQLLIIMRPGRMVSYDPESLYENNIGIPSPNWMAYTTDLMESLVLLDHK